MEWFFWEHLPPFVRCGYTIYSGIRSGPNIEEFRGIRYAQPPTSSLRFARPVQYKRTGFVTANEYGPGCPQRQVFAMQNGLSEDCLSLNIVRPAIRGMGLVPMFFWIHGGNNNNGQGALYDGIALLEKSVMLGLPIIYVGINYRLNGFGFLASEKLQRLGTINLGLHDQRMALEWVRDNIGAFGGDKNRISLVGESAGSANIWAHVVHQGTLQSPLFHAAALLSGAPGGIYPHVDNFEWFEPAFVSLLNQTG